MSEVVPREPRSHKGKNTVRICRLSKRMSSSNRMKEGRSVREGATVRLCGLAKQAQYNDRVCLIVKGHREGRCGVRLLDDDSSKEMRVKPINMRVVCSSCWKDDKNCQSCSRCGTVYYCSKECQRSDWKKHKANCGEQNSSLGWDYRTQDHPSWNRLNQPQRHSLRQYHANCGCNVPWPVSCESDALLDPPAPCFLTVHPNMRFRIDIIELPTYHVGYNEYPEELRGKSFPKGQVAPIIRRVYSRIFRRTC